MNPLTNRTPKPHPGPGPDPAPFQRLASRTYPLIDESGTILHSFTRDRGGNVTVTKNSPSDKATSHPIEVIQGIDGKGKASSGSD